MKKQRFLGFLTAAVMCITALPMSVRAADTAVTVPAAELCDVIAPHQNNDYSYDPNGTGLKDYMGKFFRIGTCLNRWNAQNQQATEFIKKNYNSVTCENEMKPDSICVQKDSYNDNIAISLSSAAPILRFAEQNGIGVRGHTFVWYAQTPEWIFKEDMQHNSGNYVSPERMNKRLESMIRNTFEAIKRDYPRLKLYAYDVCNELFQNDGGGFRGDGKEFSNWWKCYGNDSFVINAFKYARQYAPEGCKLYMNDYNEYFVAKCDDLYNMAKKILAEGDYIDGIGMQSHMHYCDFGKTGSATLSTDPQFGTYADAIDKFNSLGLDVQITELDVTTCSKEEGANLFVDIFKVSAERSLGISSVSLWGHCDGASWRQSYKEADGTQGGNPLPFDRNCNPKSFYQSITALRDTVTVFEPQAEEPYQLGDVNEDGALNAVDMTLVKRAILAGGNGFPDARTQKIADVTQDGAVTVSDILWYVKYLTGEVSDFEAAT